MVRYARHALDTDEVKMHIQSGKRVTAAMTWRERASFVLNELLQLKKLSLLDLVFEQALKAKTWTSRPTWRSGRASWVG